MGYELVARAHEGSWAVFARDLARGTECLRMVGTKEECQRIVALFWAAD